MLFLVNMESRIFRKISANDQNLKEFFCINQDKINSFFPGNTYSGIFLRIQRSVVDGSENPCVPGSTPALATILLPRCSISSNGF